MATALLVVDMQNVFLPMTSTALPNILRLTSHFRNISLPMIYTQHGHTKEELTPPYKNQLVRKWGPEGSIAKGTKPWELIPEIAEAAKGCPVVGKNTYDAFINTDIETMLKEKGVEKVVVCGVLTDCCCDTTTKSAFNRGFETLLVGDACGTASKKQHEAGLKVFETYYEEVVNTDDVLKMFS
ncbi:MAG: hypothetical protein Q9217_004871 [Psora testacea]